MPTSPKTIAEVARSGLVVTVALLAAIILSACGRSGTVASDGQPERPADASGLQSDKPWERVPEAAPAITGEVPEQLLNLVYADLESVSGASAAEFEVVLGAFREWADGAMGCRRPGEMVTHTPVRGYHVIVALRGARYDYRVSERGQIRLCKPGRTPPGGNPPAQ